MIIAIDGPAGSGKSTIAKLVAVKLDFLYIDTGAMYRALTLKAMQTGLDLKDEAVLVNLAKTTSIKLQTQPDGKTRVLLDNLDVTKQIRTPEVTNNISYIADVPGVREQMVKLQRAVGHSAKKGAVLEGRDIGTVVFPDAEKKFYLDASVEERAHRRHKELLESGIERELNQIKEDIIVRDDKDKKRKVGTLKKAQDAVFVDTTNLTIQEVTEKVLSGI